MTVEWDYTELAKTYGKRPPYSHQLLLDLLTRVGACPGMRVCDMGAGTGNLTAALAEQGLAVEAVEPNGAMRAMGRSRTRGHPSVIWHAATAESTGFPPLHFDLVTFASSFNVVRRREALKETWRILRRNGWFACLWNFRDLTDPLQQEVEALIHSFLPDYRYGARREDQTPVIEATGLFGPTEVLERYHVQRISRADWIDAWNSHATLRRQAGDRFPAILAAIDRLLMADEILQIPYVTRAWLAPKN